MTSVQLSIYRAMRPAQRLQVAFGLHEFAYRRVAEAISRNGRQTDERELRDCVLRRFVGEPGTVLRRGAERA